jgi:four helix bundle protein
MLNERQTIQERSFDFACRIVQLADYLHQSSFATRIIARQLLDAGTSIGANLEEASAAQSKPDFISKCSIASKEARETRYWLRLLESCHLVSTERISPLTVEAGEIVAIITTIVKNAEASKNRGRNSTFNIKH